MAICSGVKPTGCQPQYVSKATYIKHIIEPLNTFLTPYALFQYCIGGGGYYPTGTLVLCGDFNAFDWTIFGGAGNHKAAQKMIDATMLLFYR